ncbi:hypothetical protein [Heliomarina baculiformis]|uniref:hypothetical protein n=1 Tax=Heliomarina baculiformis TaxID=2872036 RepID=UPI001EE371EF|nr:hypothetical protein [Heliomarina baculiformis]
MTETMIDLPGVIAKSDDADFLRELIQDAAQRLMDIEVSAVCGAGPRATTNTPISALLPMMTDGDVV